MQYRLIALDLDGTLLGSDKEISPRNRAALAAARERGIVTVIATGRAPHSAVVFSQQIGGGPVICCNGAAILDEAGQYLVQKGIPRAPLIRVLNLCQGAEVLCECYTPGGIVLDKPLAQARAYFRWVKGRQSTARTLVHLVQMWRLNRMKVVRSLLRWAEQPGAPVVLKLMVIGEPERLHRLAEQVRREVPGLEISSSGHDNLELTAAGVSKGTGLEMLGARLKIPRQAMIAMGDSENDLEMLRYAGLGVAMSNATDEAKAAADRVTQHCDEDGVAVLLEEVCLT
ncbi:MAG: Cof-type HAD-IIB family hydrolase [Bacillota bacterium]